MIENKKEIVFTRKNIKPVLLEILNDSETLRCNYEFYEEDPDNQEIFEKDGEPIHIEEGEPGYEKRVKEVIDFNMSYLIGDDDSPDNTLINYLNDNLKFIPVMSFSSKEDFQFLKKKMKNFSKSHFFLEDKACDEDFDFDNPPDFSKEVFLFDKMNNNILLDKNHKYVLISRSDDEGDPDEMHWFDWGEYFVYNYMYLRDDCKLCWIIEHNYKIKKKTGTVVCKFNEFSKVDGEITDAFLVDIVNDH